MRIITQYTLNSMAKPVYCILWVGNENFTVSGQGCQIGAFKNCDGSVFHKRGG